jgi:hypothetical protein
MIPKCLEMITVDHVVGAVMSYYEDGTLPNIGEKRIIVPTKPKALIVPNTSVDLFAPADEILNTPPRVTIPSLPSLVRQFKTDTQTVQTTKVTIPGDPFDDPVIGGRITIFILLYGDYPDMHKSCINSILRTVPPERRQLRIATNAICRQSREWLDGLHKSGHIHLLYHNNANIKKYPAMRKMFHDPEHPIEDKWILWFDDDTIANVDSQWSYKLCRVIIDNHMECQCVGCVKRFTFDKSQLEWMKTRPWYRGRDWQMKTGQPAPNGRKVFFTCGGFWAVSTKAMQCADLPDPVLGHNGGDYMLGAQLWQAGYNTASWNNRKEFVRTSSVPRRGLSEIHTGQAGWQPGGVSRRR